MAADANLLASFRVDADRDGWVQMNYEQFMKDFQEPTKSNDDAVTVSTFGFPFTIIFLILS